MSQNVRKWNYTQHFNIIVNNYEPMNFRFDDGFHHMEERVCNLAHVDTFKPFVAVIGCFFQGYIEIVVSLLCSKILEKM